MTDDNKMNQEFLEHYSMCMYQSNFVRLEGFFKTTLMN